MSNNLGKCAAVLSLVGAWVVTSASGCSASSNGAAHGSRDGGDRGTEPDASEASGDDGSDPGDSSSSNPPPPSDSGAEAASPPQGCTVKASAGDFAGVNLTNLPGTKVNGCDGGFVSSTGTLTLALTAGSPTVVDAYQGNIRANGKACAAPDGTPATTSSVQSIVIKGSSGNDALTIDLFAGDFGKALLGKAGSFSVDLGGGTDGIAIRGTACSDTMFASSGAGGATYVDMGGGQPALHALGIESLLVSLGPGDDSFAGLGVSPVQVPLHIFGDAGNDSIQGGAMSDILNGGPDEDTFDPGASPSGDDVLNGGGGEDAIGFDSRTQPLNITLCTSTTMDGCVAPGCPCKVTSGQAGEKLLIVNIDDVSGGSAADVITGDEDDNQISGNDGDDVIEGGPGSDTIYGDNGNDTIKGGDDSDTLTGGDGVDTIDGEAGDANICVCNMNDPAPANCQFEITCPQ